MTPTFCHPVLSHHIGYYIFSEISTHNLNNFLLYKNTLPTGLPGKEGTYRRPRYAHLHLQIKILALSVGRNPNVLLTDKRLILL